MRAVLGVKFGNSFVSISVLDKMLWVSSRCLLNTRVHRNVERVRDEPVGAGFPRARDALLDAKRSHTSSRKIRGLRRLADGNVATHD